MQNQIYTVNDTLVVSGDVFTETEGASIDVNYTLESLSGKTTTFLKNYVSTSSPETFSFSIPLSSYPLGSYTLTVKAVTTTGVSGQKSINFAIQDKTKPTITVDISGVPKWSLSPVTVNVSADDSGGSGYRGFRYALSETTSTPTNWSSINPNKSDLILIENSGSWYLHLEAYDNIGNVTYFRTGPYYLDLDAPDFVFSEPPKWQHDTLNLGIDVQDVSNITLKKWLQGTATMYEVKTTGNNLATNSLPISMNGIYSFYAIDENNQETLETYNVSNINYSPSLNSSPSKLIIPYTSKSSFDISTSFSHSDDVDPIQLVTDLGSLVLSSINNYGNTATLLNFNWNNNYSDLIENTLYSGDSYLKDSRGGISNKISTQIEVYNPNLTVKSKVTGMNLSWSHSKLSQDYRLLRNGEVIYTGNNNYYFDNGVASNTSYNYELEVLINGSYISVETISKNSGYSILELPTSLVFPDATLGINTILIPDYMDLQYVKYEDLSEEITPYSLRVSVTNFTSSDSSFSPESFVIKDMKKLDRSNLVIKTFSDVYITETPTELVSSTETVSDSYTKLKILRSNIELIIPNHIKLNTQQSEVFNSTIIWDITYTP